MRKRLLSMTLLCCVALILSGSMNIILDKPAMTLGIDETEDRFGNGDVTESPPLYSEMNIVAVGDVMVHGPQLKAQYEVETGKHNFLNNFQHIQHFIQKADLACANLETTFAGEERGYSSYPMFNSPDSLAEAIKQVGFDVIATANNHSIDTGSYGMKRTIEVLRSQGLNPIGTRSNEIEDNFTIYERENISVGLTAFTYETPTYRDNKTLNALLIPKESELLINTFGYETLENDLYKMKDVVDQMKKKGAELIVFYIHWGNEYQRQPNDYQTQIAQRLSEYGVNIIFGSHPHVLQPIEFITNSKGKETLVVYSLGNFLSNQRYEILKNRYTEDGMIVDVQIRKNAATNHVEIKNVKYIPTWVHRYRSKNRYVYQILPILEDELDREKYQLIQKESLWRAENSRKNTIELISQNTDPRIRLEKPKLAYRPHRQEIE